MRPERWRRIEALFAAAVDLPPLERQRFLDESCAGDADLRAEVESLILHETASGSDLRQAVEAAALSLGDTTDLAGRTFGAYRLIREIGRGGMGRVYFAERSDGRFEKQVAIKVMRWSGDAPFAERFRQERKILATLEHPNIVKLLDAGSSGGVPFAVMEYVDGEPVDRYCNARGLSVRQRLELFREICEAVAFAHRHLIVHRDLKPGNILVGGDGVPKLLDFGIAKLLDVETGAGDGDTAMTRFPVLTPQFASPEQIRGERVTTATDVYSLGVVLYLLLVDSLPHDFSALRMAEIERAMDRSEPRLPSEVCRSRSRARELRGDLDRVVLKALEKDSARRYESARELSDDLRRFLRHEPVLATAPSAVYRLSRLVRRHRVGAAATIVVVAALAGGTVLATIGLSRATVARREAQIEAATTAEVNAFLRDMLSSAQPARARGEEVTVRSIVEQAAQRIEGRFVNRPEAEAAVRFTIGDTLQSLGDYRGALPHLERAVELYRARLGPDDERVLQSLDRLGMVHWLSGDLPGSLRISLDVLGIRERTVGREHPQYSAALGNVANTYADMGQLDEAERLHRQALDIDRRVLSGEQEADLAFTLNNLATVLVDKRAYAEAIELHEESLSLRRRHFGEDSPSVAIALANLGQAQHGAGRSEDGERSLRQAVALATRVFGSDHSRTASVLVKFGTLLSDTGRTDEAETILRKAVAIFERTVDPEAWNLAAARGALGRALVAAGRTEEGRRELQTAHDSLLAALGPEHVRTQRAGAALSELEPHPEARGSAPLPRPRSTTGS